MGKTVRDPYVPDRYENEPTGFMFIRGDLYSNENKLLILIHGSGAVRAGQWTRRYVTRTSLIGIEERAGQRARQ